MALAAASMPPMRFDGRTVIITGAGGGLGRAYALLLASRGANVVVNDVSPDAAAAVVAQIKKDGGRAVADSNSVIDAGNAIVDCALKNFGGRVDVVINNAGILRDKSFIRMTEAEWNAVIAVHLRGAYSVTKAAWPIMLRQKYGRIINATSAAGIYGNPGQANYAAAKLALHGFALSLAQEGAKHNITCNSVAPIAASRMTETVMPPEILQNLSPELVAPFVAFLAHDSCKETGSIYEVGAGFAAKLRRQRACGALFNPRALSADLVASNMAKICDFNILDQSGLSQPYPTTIMQNDWIGLLKRGMQLPEESVQKKNSLRFDSRVAIVTGAGSGLGRAYALHLAALGAAVLVNDQNGEAAVKVAEEIKSKGGKAAACSDSVEHGERIVEAALRAFGGRIDILINNAGIIRDKSFARISDAEWDLVIKVHLQGTFKVTYAAWPHMQKAKFGRIVNTSSAVGLYGNFGQTNYAAAKAGIIAFSNTLAHEGRKHNIVVNTVAPNAGTAMTATVMPPEIVEALKPDYIAPFVACLAHESNTSSGNVFECGSGWMGAVRWQRSEGHMYQRNGLTPEVVARHFPKVCDFNAGRVVYPQSAQESFQLMYTTATVQTQAEAKPANTGASKIDVAQACGRTFSPQTHSYTERDVILYALGVGAKRKDLQWVYENASNFHVLPTYGIVVGFGAVGSVPLADILPSFNPMMLLHGEQYMELHTSQLPTSSLVESQARVVDIQDKGKGALVIIGVESRSKEQKLLCYNESALFIRGLGGFSSQTAPGKTSCRKRLYPAAQSPPQGKAPDFTCEEQSTEEQAAVYRLSGDLNPLHIDPEMSSAGGFKVPILHGLCTLGIGARNVYAAYCPVGAADARSYAPVRAVQCRMTAHVFPGEKLATDMWQVSPTRVVFNVRVQARGNKVVIGNASVDFGVPVQLRSKVAVGNTGPNSSAGEKLSATATTKTTTASDDKSGNVDLLFGGMKKRLADLNADARSKLLKTAAAVICFEIRSDSNASKEQPSVWVLDLKNAPGSLEKRVPQGRADVTIRTDAVTVAGIASGKLNGQKAFTSGKLKLSGNMMLAMKLDSVFRALAPSASGPKSKL